MQANWYILYTKEGWEKDVYYTLTRKKIAAFLPLTGENKSFLNSKNNSAQPLIKGYVFVNVEIEKIDSLKKIPGIINVVYWLDKPLQVKDKEVASLISFTQQTKMLKAEKVPVDLNCSSTIISLDNVGGINDPYQMVKFIMPFIGYAFIGEGVVGKVKTIVKDGAEKLSVRRIFMKETSIAP